MSEFYVGYHAKMPPKLARFLKIRLLVLAFMLSMAAMIVGRLQPMSDEGVYQEGTSQVFKGFLPKLPYPVLVAEKKEYLIVLPGKHGVGSLLDEFKGHMVELEGTLIENSHQSMIELNSKSIKQTSSQTFMQKPRLKPQGKQWLKGEIVDSKCFLGVMKPGRKKIHKPCAINCLKGGIPPLLLVEKEGRYHHYLMLNEQGEAIGADILDRVAEPVVVNGKIFRYGRLNFIQADAKHYRRKP